MASTILSLSNQNCVSSSAKLYSWSRVQASLMLSSHRMSSKPGVLSVILELEAWV